MGVRGLVTIVASLVWGFAEAQLPSRAELAQALAAYVEQYAALPAQDQGGLAPAFSPAYFDRLQLRSETDRLDVTRQRYALRVEPKLPYLRRAERELQAAQRATLAPDREEARRQAAGEAIERLFDYATTQREAQLLDTLIGLHERLVALARQRLAEPDYDVERLLDTEDDLSDLLARRNRLRAAVATWLPPVPLDRLVTAAAVSLRADDLARLAPLPDPAAGTALRLIEAELALEVAENWKIVDFVQFDYRTDLDPARERFSVGGGVRLPQPRRRNRNIDELEVDRVAELQELSLEHRERERRLALDVEQLRDELRAASEMRLVVGERQARRAQLSRVFATSPITRPDALLRIERRDLLDRLDLFERERDVLAAYAALIARHTALDEAALEAWVVD